MPLQTLFDRIPQELRDRPQWVGFDLKQNGDAPKPKKFPKVAPWGKDNASPTDAATWRSSEDAKNGLHRRNYNAIGYALDRDFVVVDLDACFDVDGTLTPFAADIVRRLNSYTERSISGTGLHVIGRGQIDDPANNRQIRFEAYGQKRFIICTGNHIEGTPDTLRDIGNEVKAMVRELKSKRQPLDTVTQEAQKPSDSGNVEFQVVVSGSPISVESAIERTLPTGYGQRSGCIFDFARALKFNCGLANAPKNDLRQALHRWHERALPNIATKPFGDSWADFLVGFEAAKIPLDETPASYAWKQCCADTNTPSLPDGFEDGAMRSVFLLCERMGRNAAEQRFFLSCRVVANLGFCEHAMAARCLKALCLEGYMSEVKKGTKAEGLASEYQWIGVPVTTP